MALYSQADSLQIHNSTLNIIIIYQYKSFLCVLPYRRPSWNLPSINKVYSSHGVFETEFTYAEAQRTASLLITLHCL